MAKGRQYAEGLVGPLDRSYYETQRDVAKQTSQTNWEDLQNQYKNLQAKLKKEQEQANRDFANGLVQVAEGSLDRMNTAQDAMATSGLSYSGLSDVMQQADTTRKGKEVLDLMGRAGDVSVNVANQLASANTSSARKQAQLADEIADTLGQIGAGETSAQMAYNQGLAGIGEAMEAREAENDLAAKQRAADAAASGRSKELAEIQSEIDAAYERQAILDLLQTSEIDDTTKTRILQTRFGIDADKNIVDTFKAYSGKSTKVADYNNSGKSVVEDYNKQNGFANNSIKMQQALIDGDFLTGKERDDLYKYMRYKTLMDVGKTEQAKEFYVSEKDAQKALDAAYTAMNSLQGKSKYNLAKGEEAKPTLDSLWKMYRYNGDRMQLQSVADAYNAYDNYVKNKPNWIDELPQFADVTYGELAELLYGNK